MRTPHLQGRLLPATLLLAIALTASAGGACGDNGGSTSTLTFTTSSGSSANGATTSATTSSGSSSSTGSGTGGAGGGCQTPEGCWNCNPTSDKEFLNHCTDSQCAPFDDVARLPLYNGGNLPPLP